jgi:hypothetical protein
MSAPRWLKDNWNLPLQGVVAVIAAASGFFVAAADTSHLGYRPAELAGARGLIILAAWLLLCVPARQYARKSDSGKWLRAGVILLVVALAALLLQSQLRESWTCHSASLDKRFTVGNTYTAAALEGQKFIEEQILRRTVSDADVVKALREIPPCRLVEGSQQNPERVWEPGQLRFRRAMMSGLYVTVAPLFAIAFICAVQALYCARGMSAGEASQPSRKMFISYASDDAGVAEEVSLALMQEGYTVFFDRSRLTPGRGYHRTIRAEISAIDLFVFLISPAAVTAGRYTLTELELAQRRWPDPAGHVLPVVIAETPWADIPQYLKAVTVLEPEGSVAAEVAAEVERLLGVSRPPGGAGGGVAHQA